MTENKPSKLQKKFNLKPPKIRIKLSAEEKASLEFHDAHFKNHCVEANFILKQKKEDMVKLTIILLAGTNMSLLFINLICQK